MTTRRAFFKTAGLGAAAAAGASATGYAAESCGAGSGTQGDDSFKLGLAGYTFVKFNTDDTLKMVQQVGVKYLCIKDFHLPLTCTAEEAAAFHKKCAEFGVVGYGCGPIYMETPEAAQRAFEHTKLVGVKTLVGVPFKMVDKKRVENPELLEVINELVKQHDIKYAIHNHGPDMPELFPNAESMIKRVAHLDPRVGLCLDIGHEYRDGCCPIKAILEHHERIHDMHIKNVDDSTKKGRSVEMPRGKIDMVAVVRALRKVKYSGVCSLEYEKNMNDPLLGIAESIGYFKGVMDATR